MNAPRAGPPLLAIFVLSLSLGCNRHHERAKVAVSVFPVYDIVRRIAGPDADVRLVVPPGTSLQGWVPPPDAMAKLAESRVFISVGLGVDPWMDDLAAASPKARVLKLGDRVPTIASPDGAIDGYVWMDPQRARLMVTAIAEDLARADSSHALAFHDRAGEIDRSLAALDKEIEARTSSWSKRAGAVLPPTLAYFGERYGIGETDGSAATGPRVPEASIDPMGGASAKTGTYEDVIRFDTAALEPLLR